MKTVKKLLALLLAMVMILGMLPLGTLAQENGHDHLEGCTGEDCTAEGCTCRCHYRHLDTCLEGCTGTLAEGEACECDCHFVHLETCLADCTGTVEVDGQTQECACECHDHIEECVENCVGETKDGEACACSCHHTVESCTLDCAGEDCDCVCHEAAALNLEKPEPETKCATCGSTEHTTENHPKEEPKDETKCATCNSTEHTTENHPKEEPKDETKCATCNSTEHTTENHPKEEPKDETKCATCNSTEHTTENHPKEEPKDETKCATCGSTEHTTENHPANPKKCSICETEGCTKVHVQCLTCGTWDCQEHPASTDSTEATETTAATETTVVLCETCGEEDCICQLEELYLLKGASIFKDYQNAEETPKIIEKWNTAIKVKETVTSEDGTVWYEFTYASLWKEFFNGYKYVRQEDTTPLECVCNAEGKIHAIECDLFEEDDEEDFGTDTPDVYRDLSEVNISNLPSGAYINLPVISGEKVDILSAVPATKDNHNISQTELYDIKVMSDGTAWQPGYPVNITVSGLFDVETYIDDDGNTCTDVGFDGGIIEVRHYLDNTEAIRQAMANGSAKYFSFPGISEVFPEEAEALLAVDPAREDTLCYTVSSSANGNVVLNKDGSLSFSTESFSVFQINTVFVTPDAETSVGELDEITVRSDAILSHSETVSSAPKSSLFSRLARTFSVMPIDDTDENPDGGDDNEGEEGEEGEEGGVGNLDAATKNEYVVTSKKVEYDAANDIYKLILESYLKGLPTKTSEHKVPSDIVLVLDQSGSMNYCFYCGAKNAASQSNHATYGSQVKTSTTYWKTTDQSEKLHYCSICEAWSATKDHESHKSAKKYLPCPTKNDPKKDAFYFYKYNASTKKYSKVIANQLDTSGKIQYYIKDNSTYKKVYYCQTCERWFNGSHKHAANGSVSAKGTQYYPEISTSFEVTYQPFYAACSEREAALRSALNRFVSEIKAASVGDEHSKDDDVHNRLAIVGFGSDQSSANSGPASIEILSSDLVKGYDDGNFPAWEDMFDSEEERKKNENILRKSLRDMSTTDGQKAIDDAIKAYTVKGNTWTGHGMRLAYWLMESVKDESEQRNKVVILFTDGVPYRNGDGYGHFGEQANFAVEYAYKFKHDMNATVYSIGIFSDANGAVPAPAYTGSLNGSNYTLANRLLHLISSNYPNAKKWGKNESAGDVAQLNGKSYYLSPDTTGALSDVFSQIATEINAGGAYIKELDDKTIVQDTVSDYFTILENGKIKAYTKSFSLQDGQEVWVENTDELTSEGDNPALSITRNGKQVQVTGFDFTENYVATDNINNTLTPRGKKLILEIPIEGEFAASGLKLPTNDMKNSGIFYPKVEEVEGTTVTNLATYENFDVPYVDLMPDITLKKEVVGGDLMEFSYELHADSFHGYEDDGYQASSGNYLVADRSENPEDTIGIAEITLKAEEDPMVLKNILLGSQLSIVEKNASHYHVAVSLDGGTTWTDGKTSWFEKSEGSEDASEPDDGDVNEDEDDNGTENPDVPEEPDEPVIPVVPCVISTDTAGNTVITVSEVTGSMDIVIRNTLRYVDLKIEKKIEKSDFAVDLDQNQSFMFELEDSQGTKQNLIIKGNGSLTVKDLPVGTYKIKELTDWSWRYDLVKLTYDDLATTEEDKVPDFVVNNSAGAYEFTLSPFGGELTFTNKRAEDLWLDGNAYCDNSFVFPATSTNGN